jgi:hypothetical protein
VHDLLAEVFPYLLAFYALDCLLYVRRGQIGLVSSFGRPFRGLEPGMHIVPPWPDVRVVVADDLLIADSAGGLHALVREVAGQGVAPRPDQFATAGVAAVADGQVEARSVVDRDGRRLCLAPSSSSARAIREIAVQLRDGSGRTRLTDLLGGPARAAWLRTRRTALEGHLRSLRILTGAAWLTFFGAIPVALYVVEAPAALGGALAAFLATYVAIQIKGNAALRDAGVGSRDRWRALSPALLFPPAACHLLAVFERDLYAGVTATTVAAGFLEREGFLRYAARRLRRIEALARAAAGSAAEAVWRVQSACIEMELRGLGTSADTVLAAAEKRTDVTAASWCPVCMAEYRAGADTCSDCGLGLLQYN